MTGRANEERVAGNAFVTAAAQVVSMLLGAALAVVVVLEFGKNARTDGLFAAYGVYGFVVLVAQSVRTTLVARLVEGESLQAQLDRFVAAMTLIALAAAVPFVALGGPIAGLLTGDLGDEAADTAQSALAIFWLAAAAQLAAGLAAAALAARRQYGVPAVAYVAGGVVAIVSLLVFADRAGIEAVAAAVAAGALVTAAVMFARLGYRPGAAAVRAVRRGLPAAWVVVAGAFGFLVAQLAYIVSLGFAARVGEGAVTLYTYAFFAASLIVGASAGPIAIVLAAPLAETWDRRPEWLEPHLLAVLRVGLAVVVPAVAVAALVGEDLVELVLGSSLDADDARTLVVTFLALAGMLVSSAAAPVPTLAAFVQGRYVAIAAVSVATLAVHVAATAVALETGALEAIAAAASLSALVSLVAVLAVVYGRGLVRPLAVSAREVVLAAAVGALAFAPFAAAALLAGGRAARVGAVLAGLAAFALLVRRLLPQTWAVALRLVRKPA